MQVIHARLAHLKFYFQSMPLKGSNLFSKMMIVQVEAYLNTQQHLGDVERTDKSQISDPVKGKERQVGKCSQWHVYLSNQPRSQHTLISSWLQWILSGKCCPFVRQMMPFSCSSSTVLYHCLIPVHAPIKQIQKWHLFLPFCQREINRGRVACHANSPWPGLPGLPVPAEHPPSLLCT